MTTVQARNLLHDSKNQVARSLLGRIETNAIKFGEPIKQSLVSIFKNRIWSTSDLSMVLQFRNSVTEMLMLDFINLDEYIELSNEVDKYIQYTLSNGGIK